MLASFTWHAQEDPKTGKLVVAIPAEILQALDWQAGDRMHWSRTSTGLWELVNRSWLRRRERGAPNCDIR
jgi:hypothetical protein